MKVNSAMSGPARGAVDGEEAQAGRWDAEQVRVAVRHQFVGALGGGVQADRMVGGAGFGERNVAVEAVHGTGRGVDQVANRRLADRFEHAQETVHVVRGVGERIAERVADAGLRGEVAHRVEALFCTQGADRRGLGKVEALEAQSRLGGDRFGTARFATDDPEFAQAVQLQLDVVVAVEVVDPEHTVSEVDQAARQMEADETGYASDENLHNNNVLCAVRRLQATGIPSAVEPELVGPVHEVAFPVGVGDRELGGDVAQVVVGEQDVGAAPTVPITNTLSPVKSNIFWASSNHLPEPNSDRRNWRCQSK